MSVSFTRGYFINSFAEIANMADPALPAVRCVNIDCCFSSECQLRDIVDDDFRKLFSSHKKTYVVIPHLNSHLQAIHLRGHNMSFFILIKNYPLISPHSLVWKSALLSDYIGLFMVHFLDYGLLNYWPIFVLQVLFVQICPFSIFQKN